MTLISRIVLLILLIISQCPSITSYVSESKVSLASLHSNVDSGKKVAVTLNRKKIDGDNVLAISANQQHCTDQHKMSIVSLIIAIVADLCPHGMLPLAFGIAQGPTGFIPAMLLLVVFGSMSGYTMKSLGILAADTGSKTISELWGKLLNKRTKWMADVAIFLLCFGCNIFYSAFVGDIFAALASAVGITGIASQRWLILLTISSGILLPLCLLEDISALQFSSVLGVGCIGFTLLFHVMRYFDGTYAPTAAMTLKIAEKLRPVWPTKKFPMWGVGSGALVLINMLCVAFLAHYNAINYYDELDQPTHRRYEVAVAAGFGIAAVVFAGMMFLGYAIFGLSAQPLILNNFHRSDDPLATAARLATGLAITFAYPLMFAGLKSSMFSLMETMSSKSQSLQPLQSSQSTIDQSHNSGSGIAVVSPTSRVSKNQKTAAIITAMALITAVAVKCGEEDVSVVLGVVGSVLGCGVVYVMPGLMQLSHMRARKREGLKNNGVDVLVNHLLVLIGGVFGVLGAWITVATAGSHESSH